MMRLVVSSVLILSLASLPVSSNTRKVKTEWLCAGFNDSKGAVNIAHSQAVGPNDTLHYVFATVGLPTLLVALTPLHSNIILNCSKFLSSNPLDSVSFKPRPISVYAMAIPKLIEYDDVNDDADFNKTDNTTTWRIHSLSDLHWDDANITSNLSANIINVTASQSQDQLQFQPNTTGSFSIQFEVRGDTVRSETLPRLQFNDNTSQLDIRLNNLEPEFNHSRFGLELTMVTQREPSKVFNLTVHKNLDDEHSPGNFKLVDWTTEGESQHRGAFAQWKPICYRNTVYNTRSASVVKDYGLEGRNTSQLDDMKPTLISACQELYRAVEVQAINVSFGLPKDKFYNDTGFNGWILSVGTGLPPSDSLSLTIIIIIAVGLGLPALILSMGCVFICIRRHKDGANKLYVDINAAEGYSRIG